MSPTTAATVTQPYYLATCFFVAQPIACNVVKYWMHEPQSQRGRLRLILLAVAADRCPPPRRKQLARTQPCLLMQPVHHVSIGHNQKPFSGGQFVRPVGEQFFSECANRRTANAKFVQLLGVNRVQFFLTQE